jgi:hypothetical protein
MRLNFKFCSIFLFLPLWSHAADVAVLRNGNSIRHERREVIGSVTRLYLNDTASGYIEIPSDQIARFESDPVPAPSSPNAHSKPAAMHSSPTVSAGPSAILEQPVPDRASLEVLVNGVAQRHQIDPDFINSVIRAESGFNSRAVSRKGAQGLMQLMPQTASQLGIANSFDPKSNVEGGTKYLRELLEKYNYDVPKALAAYNAGARRVDQYRGVPPYFETRTYVAKIIRDYNRKKLAENPALAHKGKSAAPHSNAGARTTAPRAHSAQTATNTLPNGSALSSR